MDPITAGSLIVGGSSLLGGAVSSIFGRSNSRRSVNLQKELATNLIQYRVQDARRAGIHPLAALGTPTQSVPNIPVFDHMGQAISQAGHAIGTGFAKRARIQDVKLDLEYKRLRNLQMAKEAGIIPMVTGQPVTKNDWRLNRFAPDAWQLEVPSKAGVSPVVRPGQKVEIQPGGNRLLVPVTQGGGIDEDPMGFFQRFGLNFWRYLKAMDYPIDPLIPNRKFHKYEARLETKPRIPPPKGHVWKYQRVSGTWKPVHRSRLRPSRKDGYTKRNFKAWQRFRGIR